MSATAANGTTTETANNPGLGLSHPSGGTTEATTQPGGQAETLGSLASRALQYYQAGALDKSLETLQRLAQLRGETQDPKVEHNIAIVRYALGGGKGTAQLYETLQQLKRICEARQQEAAAAVGAIAIPTQTTPTTAPSGDSETDISLLSYNLAVLAFHQRQYETAMQLLEALFNHIDPLPEALAIRICFLLLDVYLATRSKDQKAYNIISHVEKLFAATPRVKQSLQLYKARYFLLHKNAKQAKRELKGTVTSASKEAAAGAITAPPAAAPLTAPPHMLPTIIFLKANIEYLRQNYRKAVKLLNACANSKAVLGAGAAIGSNGVAPSVVPITAVDRNLPFLYYNAMGCIHYRTKKYHAALYYFAKALKENNALLMDTGDAPSTAMQMANGHVTTEDVNAGEQPITPVAGPLPTVALQRMDRRAEILSNLGLQLLITGKPEAAFRCFQESALFAYKRPRTWLRMAECCISAHVLKLREAREKNMRSALVVDAVGSGKSRRLLLPTSGGPPRGLQQQERPMAEGHVERREEQPEGVSTEAEAAAAIAATAAAVPTGIHAPMALEFASKCLHNVLYLLSLAPMAGEDHALLLQTALADLAYVALSMDDPYIALDTVRKLLALPYLSTEFAYLAHTYAAEALCVLNRPSEALTHLQALVKLEGNADTAATAMFSPQARSTLYTNLATVYIVQADIAQAQRCVSQALELNPASSPALLMQVYLELLRDNHEAALDIIKRRTRPTPPRSQSPPAGAAAAPPVAEKQ